MNTNNHQQIWTTDDHRLITPKEFEMNGTFKAIRKELKSLGIKKAIVGNTTYDGTPCVQLRWNGQDEYVSATHFALGAEDIRNESDDQYLEWLKSTYADVNLK